MKVPNVIYSKAKELLGKESLSVSYLGKRDGASYYCAFLADSKTGFPLVLSIDRSQEITVFGGFLALDISSSFNS